MPDAELTAPEALDVSIARFSAAWKRLQARAEAERLSEVAIGVRSVAIVGGGELARQLMAFVLTGVMPATVAGGGAATAFAGVFAFYAGRLVDSTSVLHLLDEIEVVADALNAGAVSDAEMAEIVATLRAAIWRWDTSD